MQQYSALPVGKVDETKLGFGEPSTDNITNPPAHSHILTWPTTPKTLRASTTSRTLCLLPHVILLLVPIASLGLGIAVLSLDGKGESRTGNSLKQATTVTATLWPIIFAAVISPLLRACALYQAERGTKLGILEILSSSQTLVSTLRACFTLRILSTWPIVLVILWSLSPAGGQGALRSLDLRENITTTKETYASYPPNTLYAYVNGPWESGSGGLSTMNQFRLPINAAFSGQDIGLLQGNTVRTNQFIEAQNRIGGPNEAARITKRDVWRNIRIPMLHSLAGYTTGSADWVNVQPLAIPHYSSLIGVPVRGLQVGTEGNASFMIQTNYQAIQCKPWVSSIDWLRAHNSSLLDSNITTDPWDMSIAVNTVGLGYPNIWLNVVADPGRFPLGPTPLLYNNSRNASTEPTRALTLAFYTRSYNLTLCDVRTEYVDCGVECSRAAPDGDLACSVSKIRHTPDMKGLGNLTLLDVARNIQVLKQIPYTMASLHRGWEPSILEKWLKDPPTAFGMNYSNTAYWYEDISLPVFSNRLAMVLNTYLQASLGMSIIVGSDGTWADGTWADGTRADGTWADGRGTGWARTTGTWTQFTLPVYHVNRSWFALYFVAAVVLTLSALANIILRSLIHVPDFLGSISALTRDSHFFSVPTPASGMDGTERARLLQNKWVMIQDVRPNEAVGRIAFSDAVAGVELKMDRRYA